MFLNYKIIRSKHNYCNFHNETIKYTKIILIDLINRLLYFHQIDHSSYQINTHETTFTR